MEGKNLRPTLASGGGPAAYGTFLAERSALDEAARLRREAVAAVREYLDAFRAARTEPWTR